MVFSLFFYGQGLLIKMRKEFVILENEALLGELCLFRAVRGCKCRFFSEENYTCMHAVSICVGSYLARRKEEGSNEARREAVSSARHLQKYEEVGAKKEPVYLSPST